MYYVTVICTGLDRLNMRTKLKTTCSTYAASVFVCILFSSSLLFPFSVFRTSAECSECNIDLVEYTDWMPLLPSDLMEEFDVNPEAFHQGRYN